MVYGKSSFFFFFVFVQNFFRKTSAFHLGLRDREQGLGLGAGWKGWGESTALLPLIVWQFSLNDRNSCAALNAVGALVITDHCVAVRTPGAHRG